MRQVPLDHAHAGHNARLRQMAPGLLSVLA
jgi:hypothetical protein